MATRVDLFKAWLNLVGANPDDCELVDDAGDTSHIGNKHGCYGFFCPEDVPMLEAEDGLINRPDCTKCKYNEFWTKEVDG